MSRDFIILQIFCVLFIAINATKNKHVVKTQESKKVAPPQSAAVASPQLAPASARQSAPVTVPQQSSTLKGETGASTISNNYVKETKNENEESNDEEEKEPVSAKEEEVEEFLPIILASLKSLCGLKDSDIEGKFTVTKLCSLDEVIKIINNNTAEPFAPFSNASQGIINQEIYALDIESSLTIDLTDVERPTLKFSNVIAKDKEEDKKIINGLEIQYAVFSMDVVFGKIQCIFAKDFTSEGNIGNEFVSIDIKNISNCANRDTDKIKLKLKFADNVNAEKVGLLLSAKKENEVLLVNPVFNGTVEIAMNKSVELILYSVKDLFEMVIPGSSLTPESIEDIRNLVNYTSSLYVQCGSVISDMRRVSCSILANIQSLKNLELKAFARIAPKKYKNIGLIKEMKKANRLIFQSSPSEVTVSSLAEKFQTKFIVKTSKGETEMYNPFAVNGNCIRYTIEKSRFNDLGIDEETADKIITQVCFEGSKIVINTIPEIKSTGTKFANMFKDIVDSAKVPVLSNELKKYPEKILLESIVITKIDIVGLNMVVNIRFSDSLAIIPSKVKLAPNAVIPIALDLMTREISYSVESYVDFLGYFAKVNIESTADKNWMVTGEMPIKKISQLKKDLNFDYLNTVYNKTFTNLHRIYIKNASFNTVRRCDYIFMQGDIKLNEQNATMELIYKPSTVNVKAKRAQPSSTPAGLCIEQNMLIKNKCEQTDLDKVEEAQNEGASEDEDEGGLMDLVLKRERGGSLKWLYHYLFTQNKFQERNIGFLHQFQKIVVSMQRDGNFYSKFKEDSIRRPKCAYVEEKFKRIFDTESANFKGGILIHAADLDLTCRSSKTKVSIEFCSLLREIFQLGDEKFLDVDYYGEISPSFTSLKAVFDRDLKLAPGVFVTDAQHVMNETINPKSGKTIATTNQITGILSIDYLPKSCVVKVEINIVGNVVNFKFNDFNTTTYGITLLGTPYVEEQVIRSLSSPVKQAFDYIELQSDLTVGSPNFIPIKIQGKKGLTRQFVYGKPSKNRFYACRKPDDVIAFKDILLAFMDANRVPVDGLFTKRNLIGLCVTYHNDEKRWNISEELQAQKGLWLHGEWELPEPEADKSTLCGKSKKKSTVSKNKIHPVAIQVSNNELIIKGELPVLRFADYVKNKTECKVESNLKIVKSEEENTVGPIVVAKYRLDTGFQAGFIQGYVITPVFKTFGRLVMKDLNPKTCNIKLHDPTQFVFRPLGKGNKEIKIDSVDNDDISEEYMTVKNLARVYIKGSMADSLRQSPVMFKFRLINNVQAINAALHKRYGHLEEHMSTMKTSMQASLYKLNRFFKKTMQPLKNEYEKSNIEMVKRRSELEKYEKVTGKVCGNNCNSVVLPGFEWSNSKCTYRRSFGNMSCLHYTNDAYVASDVDCLLKCENKRQYINGFAQQKRSEISKSFNSFTKDHAKNVLLSSVAYTLKDVYPANVTKLVLDASEVTPVSVQVGNEDTVLLGETEWKNAQSLRSSGCNKYLFKHNKKIENVTFCLDNTIYDQIAKYIFDTANEENSKKFKRQYDTVQAMHDQTNFTLLEWKVKHKNDLRRANESKTPTIKRSQQLSIRDFIRNSEGFSSDPYETNLILNTYAPWHMIKNNDPLMHMPAVQAQQATDIEAAAYLVKGKPCLETRSKVDNIHNMLQYMKSWTDSFTVGYASMKKYHKNAKRGIRELTKSTIKRGNIKVNGSTENIPMNKWIKKAHLGYKSWMKESSRQLKQLNVQGPQFMKNNLKNILTPANSETLETFIYRSSQEADVSFKKAFIAKDKPFENIAMNVINMWRTNSTLLQMAPTLNHIMTQVKAIDKRTIKCPATVSTATKMA